MLFAVSRYNLNRGHSLPSHPQEVLMTLLRSDNSPRARVSELQKKPSSAVRQAHKCAGD
jgi:hypothetical protein